MASRFDDALPPDRIAAHGFQYAAGKTWTMLGPLGPLAAIARADRGVMSRTFEALFSALSAPGRFARWHLAITYVEVYCESIYDLLYDAPSHLNSNSAPDSHVISTPGKAPAAVNAKQPKSPSKQSGKSGDGERRGVYAPSGIELYDKGGVMCFKGVEPIPVTSMQARPACPHRRLADV